MDSNSGASTVDAAATCKSLTQSGTPGIVTNNGFIVTVAGNITLLAGKYVSAADTAQLSITATCTITTGGCLMGTVLFNRSAGVLTLGDDINFRAGQMCVLQITAGSINAGAHNVLGNSAVNRLLVKSMTVGTPMTVTVTTGTFTNCDFQDIAFSSANNQPASAVTTGNCGGCSQTGGGTLTFTAGAVCTFANATGSWSNVANWVTTGETNRIPLPQDTVVFAPQSAAHTITVDMPRLPATDFSAADDSGFAPVVNAIATGMAYSCYGSVNLTGCVWTCTKAFWWVVRSNASATCNGNTLTNGSVELWAPNCTVTFLDACAVPSPGIMRVRIGGWAATGNMTSAAFISPAGTTVNLGNGTWTVTQAGTVAWYMDGSVTPGNSTVSITYVGSIATAFSGGANTYNNITIATGAGNGTVTFSGAFTFANMTVTGTTARSIVLPADTTLTMTGTSFLSGSTGAVITITTGTAGHLCTINKTGGVVSVDYVSLKDSAVGGTAIWVTGPNSTNVSGNTGWLWYHVTPLTSACASGVCRGVAVVKSQASAVARALRLTASRPGGFARGTRVTASQPSSVARGAGIVAADPSEISRGVAVVAQTPSAIARALAVTQQQASALVRGVTVHATQPSAVTRGGTVQQQQLSALARGVTVSQSCPVAVARAVQVVSQCPSAFARFLITITSGYYRLIIDHFRR